MPVVPGVPGAALPPGDDAIIRRIQELERAQKELLPAIMAIVGPQIATLTSQQATLTSQQATLTTAVANITTLINQQVTSASGVASGTATVTTTTGDYAVVTLPVPSGYSQAQVIAVSAASGSASISSILLLATRISGTDGPSNYTLVNNSTAAVCSAYSRPLTGLSGGSISISTRATTSTGTISTNLTTIASAVFLR